MGAAMNEVQRARVCELIEAFNDEIRAGHVTGAWRNEALKSGKLTIDEMHAKDCYNGYDINFSAYLQWVAE